MEKKPTPRRQTTKKQLPETQAIQMNTPSVQDKSNCVVLNGKSYEILPTRTKYFRTQWANGHVLLKHYTLSEIFALTQERDGIDGDEAIYKFLVAVFDNEDLVKEVYDELDSETLYRICDIFRRVNKIDEIEEHQKNLMAATSKKT